MLRHDIEDILSGNILLGMFLPTDISDDPVQAVVGLIIAGLCGRTPYG